MKVTVVTCSDLGWDCVISVFEGPKDVAKNNFFLEKYEENGFAEFPTDAKGFLTLDQYIDIYGDGYHFTERTVQ